MAGRHWHEDEQRDEQRDHEDAHEAGRAHERPQPGPRADERDPSGWRGPQSAGGRYDESAHGGTQRGAQGFGHAGYGTGGYGGYGSGAQQSQFAPRGRHGGPQGGYGGQQGGHGGAGSSAQQGGYGRFGEHTRETQRWMDNGYGGQEYGGGSGYGQPRDYGDSSRGSREPGGGADQGGYRGEGGGAGRGGEHYGRFSGQASYGGFDSPASYGGQGWSQPGSMQARQRRGPKGYTRSDERIRDDICDHLMRSDLDVEDVSVRVEKGHVTLEGTVPHRHVKHRIEDVVDACIGVQDIDNRLRVPRAGGTAGGEARDGDASPDREEKA